MCAEPERLSLRKSVVTMAPVWNVYPGRMSVFKFACPVCGQHVSAEAVDSGKQIECPTCFQKMVVPPAPTEGSNLIRRAASATQRRRPDAQTGDTAFLATRRRPALPWATLVFISACVLAATLAYRFKDRLLPQKPDASLLPGQRANVESSAEPQPSNLFPWSLEITNAVIPDAPAAGRLRGRLFDPDRSVLQGGVLTFRQGQSATFDIALSVMLHAVRGEDLAGKTVQIRSDQSPAPTIQVRWKGELDKVQVERHRGGYALVVSFGQPAGGHMPGKIWLSLPDADQGFLSGTFDAEIRKPPPPKPAVPPKPRQ